jgi:hypothetical protein
MVREKTLLNWSLTVQDAISQRPILDPPAVPKEL